VVEDTAIMWTSGCCLTVCFIFTVHKAGASSVSPAGRIEIKEFQNKVKRHQRDRLLRELEEIWSFMEDGMPGLEADLESHSMEEGKSERSTTRKRKRGWTKEDEG
jgi:hypothetical protein